MPTLELPEPLDPKLLESIACRDFGWAERELRKLLERHKIADKETDIDQELVNLVRELNVETEERTPFGQLIQALWVALEPYDRISFERARQDFLGTEEGISKAV